MTFVGGAFDLPRLGERGQLSSRHQHIYVLFRLFTRAHARLATRSRSPPTTPAALDLKMSFGWPTFERPELYVHLALGVFVFTIAVLIRILKGVQRCVGGAVGLAGPINEKVAVYIVL